MRVLLITPPGGFTAKPAMPPVGLRSLKAALRAAGHEAAVRDYAGRRLPAARFRRDLARFRPEALGVSVLTEWRFAAARAARLAKAFDPAIRVIAGGPHPSGAPEDTARSPHFDVVVAGEGEAAILDALTTGQRILRASPCMRLDDLPSTAPPPAGEGARARRRNGLAAFATARGCPFDCAFCATARTHGRTCRAHSIDRVMAEVEALRRAGAQVLWLVDDVLNLSADRLERLCQALSTLGPPARFIASIRTDLATRDQLARLRAAGCVRLFFGVESANEPILRQVVGKSASVAQARAVARWCDELGIEKNPGYILGLPGETATDAARTVDLMRELGGRPSLSLLRIYPGTRIERLAVERGLLPERFSWWDEGATRRLVCRPAFGDAPLFLDGLTWGDVGRLSRSWAAVAQDGLGRRGVAALWRTRRVADFRHLAFMAAGVDGKRE